MTVTNSEAVAWLADIKRSQILAPFFGEAITVGEAAELLGTNLNQTYKQVKRLERLGLLRLTASKPRQGRPLRYYQTVADAFFVPPDCVSFEDFLYQMGKTIEYRITQNFIETIKDAKGAMPGIHVSATSKTELELQAATPAGEPWQFQTSVSPSWNVWHRVMLDHEDAKALYEELSALAKKYETKQGTQPYVLRLAFAPGTF